MENRVDDKIGNVDTANENAAQKKVRKNKMVKIDQFLYVSEGVKGRISYYLRPGLPNFPEYIKIGRCALYSDSELTSLIPQMLDDLKKESEKQHLNHAKQFSRAKLSAPQKKPYGAFANIQEARFFIDRLASALRETYGAYPSILNSAKPYCEAFIVTWIKLMTPFSFSQIVQIKPSDLRINETHQITYVKINVDRLIQLPTSVRSLFLDLNKHNKNNKPYFSTLANSTGNESLNETIQNHTSILTNDRRLKASDLDGLFSQFAKRHGHFNERFIKFYFEQASLDGGPYTTSERIAIKHAATWWEEMVRFTLLDSVPCRNTVQVYLPWEALL